LDSQYRIGPRRVRAIDRIVRLPYQQSLVDQSSVHRATEQGQSLARGIGKRARSIHGRTRYEQCRQGIAEVGGEIGRGLKERQCAGASDAPRLLVERAATDGERTVRRN